MPENYNLAKIGNLVKNEKKQSHDMIVYLFQLWLEKKGINSSNLIILEEYKGLTPDIIVHNNEEVQIVFEIIEPDPSWDIDQKEVRQKLERMLIRAYSYVYKPKIIVLSNGIKMLIYDQNCNIIEKIDDLSQITNEKEKYIEKLLLANII